MSDNGMPTTEEIVATADDITNCLAFAYLELNTIRARDGAPQGVDEEYFSGLVDAIDRVLKQTTGHGGHCHPMLYAGISMKEVAPHLGLTPLPRRSQ